MDSAGSHRMACKRRDAFTLVEIVISILLLMVLVNGVLGYQYLSARDVRIAEVHAAGGRLANLMLQSWKGCDGKISFNPVPEFKSKINIHASNTGPEVPDVGNFSLHGRYLVEMNDIHFFITLAKAGASEQCPMTLHAAVAWRKDYSDATLDGTETTVRLSCYVID